MVKQLRSHAAGTLAIVLWLDLRPAADMDLEAGKPV